MKISRIIIVVLVVVIIAIIALAAYSALTPTSTSPWKSAADYPLQVSDELGVAGQQCFNSTAYVYCIGGEDVNYGPHNAVFTSSAISSSSSNITSWTADGPYPQTIYAQACVAYSGYAYCVGGTYDDSGDDVALSYYAPLNSGGAVGTWAPTTPYPLPVDSQYCVASSGYIYCAGGFDEQPVSQGSETGYNASRAESDYVYYAPLSPSGIGTWVQTTSYPSNTYLPSCFVANGYIYCLGGVNSDNNAVSTDYYAPLTAAGVGAWTSTEAYPIQGIFYACAISSGNIYCVGAEESSGYSNAVYYATVSSAGIGAWTKAANYPDSVATDCVISSGNLYCIGGVDSSGETGAAYYIPLDSLLGVATTTSSSVRSATPLV